MTGIAKHVIEILKLMGEDVGRPGLVGTPERVAKAHAELFEGYTQNPNDFIKIFEEESADEMIVSSGIRVQSHCEHHMLPFIGTAKVAYIPSSTVDVAHDQPKPKLLYKVLGISKITRIVNCFSRRLQIQERLTQQIANFIMRSELQPRGVGVIIDAEHMCMNLRGVRDHDSTMHTSCLMGIFKTQHEVRQEFLNLG